MPSQEELNRQTRIAMRDNLYFNFRYRKGSYKAKKMGLQPILIMAKRDGDMIRVYGEPTEAITPRKIQFATARFKAWRNKERELKRLERARLHSGKRSVNLHGVLAE